MLSLKEFNSGILLFDILIPSWYQHIVHFRASIKQEHKNITFKTYFFAQPIYGTKNVCALTNFS